MSGGSGSVDVVVVGAGAAGLAAARTLREGGCRVALLEAAARIGGRAWTDTETFGVPLDWGCHWLHSASINPFTRLADRWGFSYRRGAVQGRVHLEGRWDSEAERAERAGFVRRGWEAIAAAGRAGRDVAAAEVIEREHRWSAVFRFWISVMTGLDAEEVSTLDFSRYRDTGENWPLQEGYGALVARYGRGLAVRLRTPVRRIDWRRRPLRIETARGTLRSAAVIVTVSTGVLAAGDIRFDPPLPARRLEALEGVPMGQANKVAFALDGAGDLPEHGHALSAAGAPRTIGFQIRPFGRDLVVGYVGGAFCLELERAGAAAMIDHAREQLVAMFGSGLGRRITAGACSRWGEDPLVRGGYSCARPGAAERRRELGTPLGAQVFFAGEACSAEAFSTAHGALQSGIDTAREVLAMLRPAGRG